jgi:hypothetical protein
LDGKTCIEETITHWTGTAEALGIEIAHRLLRRGAGPLISAQRP